jgi:hypothetical protein
MLMASRSLLASKGFLSQCQRTYKVCDYHYPKGFSNVYPRRLNIVSLSINWNHIINILMDFVVSYARQWANREKENIYTISE